MKLVALALLLAAALPSIAQTKPPVSVTVRRNATVATAAATTGTVSTYTTFDFNWGYTPNLPACTSTLIACYDGFQLTNTTLGTIVGTPSQIGPTLLSYSYSPVSGIPYGPSSFSLVTHGYDETGTAIVSPPDAVTITVKVTGLNGPTNLQGKQQ